MLFGFVLAMHGGPDLELEDEDREVELPLAADGALVGGVGLPDLEGDAGGEQGNRIERDRGRRRQIPSSAAGGGWRVATSEDHEASRQERARTGRLRRGRCRCLNLKARGRKERG